ncbi:GAF and ANTAR domain-containing protein [Lentzea jiangxiensis]|uniref:GAF domain-containing protein n=1 Tax=Lentzea jiangxiensis TaxID=641025 RepID=A0A1H0LJG7_9PSEU|nr:GAF and ANTAR domain-containing protein [Lentzea jiangxiensis]SDO68166.1 GAF domain-containing protein [Lentzea jiangxiensis]
MVEITAGPLAAEATPADGGRDLATHLTEIALALQGQQGEQDTMDAIVHTAVGTIPGAAHAGIMTVVGKKEIRTVATTGELPCAVDQAQFDTAQGPCLTALFDEKIVSVPDVVHDERWPAFGRKAAEFEVGSMLSFQLYVQGEDLGALNLYASEPNAFDDESRHVGSLFAGHAAIALASAQERRELSAAVETRDLIGQAKGILMERHKLSADQAFTVLVRASQHTNVKLRDIAEQLTTTGQLPGAER